MFIYKTPCSIEDKNNIIFNLNNIKNKYMNLLNSFYPIIYAIKGCSKWFDDVNLVSKLSFKKVYLKTTAYISQDYILGKVEFLDGIKSP